MMTHPAEGCFEKCDVVGPSGGSFEGFDGFEVCLVPVHPSHAGSSIFFFFCEKKKREGKGWRAYVRERGENEVNNDSFSHGQQ